MDIYSKYMPPDYLALKISYCREQLEKLPIVRTQVHTISGSSIIMVAVGNHKYHADSPNGINALNILKTRFALENELNIYEAIWKSKYKEEPDTSCKPHSANRRLYIDTNKSVILDKSYFDSLINNADSNYPKPTDYPFKGIYYRSAAERDIAMFYTDAGIPFKYEPAIKICGLPKPINTDFVIYIKELDNCKFHEHFGMKNSSNYLRITKLKYCNYTDAGLVPEIDILFTHDTEDMSFCISNLTHKLNTAIAITANGTLPTR